MGQKPSTPPSPPPRRPQPIRTGKHNIIVFGQAGAGKSSVVNMLLGLRDGSPGSARTSNNAGGCTLDYDGFDVEIDGSRYKLWDTAGLNEGESGNVPNSTAIAQLYHLLCDLKDGVSLLIFVVRGPRVVDSVGSNWKLFHEIICQSQVPALVAITGFEMQDGGIDGVNQWLTRNDGENRRNLEQYGVEPVDFICMTATRGPELGDGSCVFDRLYNDSQSRLRDLIPSASLSQPWCVPPVEWFKKIIKKDIETRTFLWFWTREVEIKREIYVIREEVKEQLQMQCGLSDGDIKILETRMRRSAD
ncbi:hypothetical protein NP233_g11207 [Leucocoprinus birnbaumii]|uniref:G domain-containing protein n=1 Tax=Leucocoprinus birnbaumii TaxID=56174 RepID=A0AAD5VGV4_9AGAR|nr:hypothetical protein NP233_g11207 [Leucocoprinus birnbaumii]